MTLRSGKLSLSSLLWRVLRAFITYLPDEQKDREETKKTVEEHGSKIICSLQIREVGRIAKRLLIRR